MLHVVTSLLVMAPESCIQNAKPCINNMQTNHFIITAQHKLTTSTVSLICFYLLSFFHWGPQHH